MEDPSRNYESAETAPVFSRSESSQNVVVHSGVSSQVSSESSVRREGLQAKMSTKVSPALGSRATHLAAQSDHLAVLLDLPIPS